MKELEWLCKFWETLNWIWFWNRTWIRIWTWIWIWIRIWIYILIYIWIWIWTGYLNTNMNLNLNFNQYIDRNKHRFIIQLIQMMRIILYWISMQFQTNQYIQYQVNRISQIEENEPKPHFRFFFFLIMLFLYKLRHCNLVKVVRNIK